MGPSIIRSLLGTRGLEYFVICANLELPGLAPAFWVDRSSYVAPAPLIRQRIFNAIAFGLESLKMHRVWYSNIRNRLQFRSEEFCLRI